MKLKFFDRSFVSNMSADIKIINTEVDQQIEHIRLHIFDSQATKAIK